MLYRIEAGLFPHLDDTIGRKTAASIREALGIPVKSVRTIKVFTLEGLDARRLTRETVPEPVGAITADVSFISLIKALGPALELAAPGAFLVALVKPQFEVGPERIGKGGIVRDASARDSALEAVTAWLASQPGWRVAGSIPSPIKGGSGNVEFLIGALRDG